MFKFLIRTFTEGRYKAQGGSIYKVRGEGVYKVQPVPYRALRIFGKGAVIRYN